MDVDSAETIATAALGFLANDVQRLRRFLALTGLGPAELRAEAQSARILAAVLDYLLHDESLLLAFAANNGLEPELVRPAQLLLAQHASVEGHS